MKQPYRTVTIVILFIQHPALAHQNGEAAEENFLLNYILNSTNICV